MLYQNFLILLFDLWTGNSSYIALKSPAKYTVTLEGFLEMTESEIANLQKITQSGVFKNRHHALETMKKILKEKQ